VVAYGIKDVNGLRREETPHKDHESAQTAHKERTLPLSCAEFGDRSMLYPVTTSQSPSD
jgi:hypothetical protein